jgi:hypothetical protein
MTGETPGGLDLLQANDNVVNVGFRVPSTEKPGALGSERVAWFLPGWAPLSCKEDTHEFGQELVANEVAVRAARDRTPK